MTEPQAWVVIGVFATAIFGTLTFMTASINRNLTTAIGGVQMRITEMKESMNVRFDAVDRQFDGVERRFDGVDRRLETLETRVGKVEGKVDGLDRDVQAITRRVFGADNA